MIAGIAGKFNEFVEIDDHRPFGRALEPPAHLGNCGCAADEMVSHIGRFDHGDVVDVTEAVDSQPEVRAGCDKKLGDAGAGIMLQELPENSHIVIYRREQLRRCRTRRTCRHRAIWCRHRGVFLAELAGEAVDIVGGEDFDARQAADIVGKRAAAVGDLDADTIAAVNQRGADPRVAGSPREGNTVDIVSKLAAEHCPRFAAVALDLLVCEAGQIEMRGGVAADREPARLQQAQIVPAHQLERRPRCRIPVREGADPIGDGENSGTETGRIEQRRRLRENAFVTIIERDDDRPAGRRRFACDTVGPFFERYRAIAVLPQEAQLLFEDGRSYSPRQQFGRTVIGNAVIRQDRNGEAFARRANCLGRFWPFGPASTTLPAEMALGHNRREGNHPLPRR
jgi:hypothetical protein